MKTLKRSIFNRSSHSGDGFKAQRRELIESWLNKYDIRNYTINDDFTIDVSGDVYLDLTDLTELPEYIQFGIVKGDFDCRRGNLTSLRGCPREVGKGFYCTLNELTSLEGAPEEVGGAFCCSLNKLTSLKGAPKKVGGNFDCSNNQLISLEGAPKEVGNYFICNRNLATFTEKDVRKVCNVEGTIVI